MSDIQAQLQDLRHGNWYPMDNCIIKHYGSQIGPYGIAVYNAICMHANRNTRKAWPGMRKIAEEIGASLGKVQKTVKELEDIGLLIVEKREGENGAQLSNLYTIPVPPILREHPPTQDEHPPSPDERNNHTVNNHTYNNHHSLKEGADAPITYQEWWQELKSKDKPFPRAVVVKDMYEQLYPQGEEVDASRIIGCAKHLGDWGRMIQLLWENATRPPAGNVFNFISGIHNRGQGDNGSDGNLNIKDAIAAFKEGG